VEKIKNLKEFAN